MITVVAYLVAMHQDYTGKLPCLENKKCFVMKRRQEEGVGRGGAGSGKFVMAFLDWASHRPGSGRHDYLSATNIPEQVRRVTRNLWIETFGFTHEEFRRRQEEEEAEQEVKRGVQCQQSACVLFIFTHRGKYKAHTKIFPPSFSGTA